MKTWILLVVMLFSGASFAENFFCTKDLEVLPILQGGRVKPLFVHASESMKALTGKSKIDEYSAVEAYCLLSLNGMGLPTNIKLNARIDHVDAMKFLKLPEGEHQIGYEELLNKEEDIRNEIRLAGENESYKKSMTALFNNIFLYKEIKSGMNWTLAEITGSELAWLPLVSYLTEEKVVAQKTVTPNDPFLPVLLKSKIDYEKVSGDKYMLEYYYAKSQLPTISMALTLLALAAMVLSGNFTIALTLASLSVIAQVALVTFRVLISGRAPITNMYETVLFSGLGSLILAMVLGHLKKEKIFVYMGLSYSLCTLLMINFANGMLTATISPLVPVLRDNFWLSTHVTTIILSYGALALSWILANTILIKKKMGKMDKKEEAQHADIIYTTLKWGTTLLAAGIILGGVWADYSWGRFWGWDPKETWSLIVLCLYMAILHGRHTTWIKTERFVMVTAGAFMSVMMAWFGVNYILASGLHSYGFSEGGALFLGTFFIAQTLILIFTRDQSNKLSKEDLNEVEA